MESKEHASVNINLQEGHIAVSGSEMFVERILSAYMSKLETYLQVCPKKEMEIKQTNSTAQGSVSFEKTVQALDTQIDKNFSEYVKHGIYHCKDGKMILILSHLQGKTNSDKIRELALLMAYVDSECKIQVEELKKMAKQYACMDKKNFATILKKNTQLFIVSGKGKSKQLELTNPGIEEAKKLLDSLTTKNEKSN